MIGYATPSTPEYTECEFYCDDGRCIPYNRVCDNINDCSNGEDEECFLTTTDKQRTARPGTALQFGHKHS